MTGAVLTADAVRIELLSGQPVVEELSLEVGRGEIIGIVGESGAGKTTAGLALLGYARTGMRIAGGRVMIAGNELIGPPEGEVRRCRGTVVSYVPQSPAQALNPSMRVGRQLELMAAAHDLGPRGGRVADALERVGLAPGLADRYPHELSGGQQQRVAIAKAVICEPDVVVLDEPTTGLDVITQAFVLSEIERLCREAELGMVYISHDLAVVARIATVTLVMYAGRIVERGPTRRLVRSPLHPYTRGLVQSTPDHVAPRALRGIPGVAAGVGDRSSGCAFFPRCPQRRPICEAELPELLPVEHDRSVRCFFSAATERPRADPIDREQAGAPDGPFLSVQGVTAEHRRRGGRLTVVDEVSFGVMRGECVALVGESGSGKTTLGRCVAGLHVPSAGEVVLDGQSLAPSVKERSKLERGLIQMVFQSPFDTLNPRMRVGDSVARAALVLRGLSPEDARRDVDRLLDLVQLPARIATRFPYELSGGECQRVALGRALAADPQLLICDEVTSALDVSVQANVIALLGELQARLSLTMIFISHDLAVVAAISDRVLVLADGRVCEEGGAADVIAHPREEYTQRLIAAVPRLETLATD